MNIKEVLKEDRRRYLVEVDTELDNDGEWILLDLGIDDERPFMESINKLFDCVFLDAYRRKQEVIASIENNIDFFADTGLIGSSGDLFDKLLSYIIKKEFTGIRCFLLTEYSPFVLYRIDSDKLKACLALGNELYFRNYGGELYKI